MRIHLYEFRTQGKTLTCSCGWERTLKTAELSAVKARFERHCADEAAGIRRK